ncbi:MAG TPA: SDR family oxidoreductase [Syntrophales bacterium]|nr:SDR family oxidoreductase [Syntrophales bacterium]
MGKKILERLFSLEGKTAVLTGGYRGIGLAMAEAYAEAGASVTLVARNLLGCQVSAEKLAKTYGIKAIGKSMDVRDSKSVDRIIQEIVSEFGRIDILVNAAGIPGSEKPVLKMTDEDMDEVMNVDFRGTFLVSRAVAQFMVKQKSGRIINVASAMARIVARNMSGYAASKAAVVQLTRVMALELMKDNIQVNALCPGYFVTDFNRDFFQSEMGKSVIKKMVPLNRVGQMDELKSTALYLATCPAFMTGAEIYIDGGHTIV